MTDTPGRQDASRNYPTAASGGSHPATRLADRPETEQGVETEDSRSARAALLRNEASTTTVRPDRKTSSARRSNSAYTLSLTVSE